MASPLDPRLRTLQEVFAKEASSLRYDKERKKFVSVVEQRHLIYRLVAKMLAGYNAAVRRRRRQKNWLRVFLEQVCRAPSRRSQERSAPYAGVGTGPWREGAARSYGGSTAAGASDQRGPATRAHSMPRRFSTPLVLQGPSA